MDVKSMLPWKRERGLAERDPFALLRREMNSLFDDFFSDGGEVRAPLAEFTPRVDVKETDGEVRITAEVPGVEEKDIEIAVSGDTLTIKGEKKEEKEEKGEEYYRLERSYGAFRRSLSLPCEVDADKAAATYKKGVLTITLPKTEESKPKTLKIN